jgi:hypothetical protein
LFGWIIQFCWIFCFGWEFSNHTHFKSFGGKRRRSLKVMWLCTPKRH